MLARSHIVLLPLTALSTIPLAVAACGTSVAPIEAATPIEGTADGGPGGEGGGAPPPDVPIPTTDIDPCRGQPLPDAEHYVPPGLCARLVGTVRSVRQLTFAPNGDLFAVTGSAIYLMRDRDGDGYFTSAEIAQWASTDGDGMGNNAFLDGGFLYAGSRAGVKRFAYDPSAARGPAGEDVVVGQPTGGHGRRTAKVWGGFLYVDSGSANNATNDTSTSEFDTRRSVIKRFDLSKYAPGTPFQWAAGEIVTQGLRNANGFARNENTGKIYAVVNGLDNLRYKTVDVHADNPGEDIVEVVAGRKYGYPFCFTVQRLVDNGNVIAPGTQLVNSLFNGNPRDDAWCAANASRPTTFVQAHTAPLDIAFFDRQPKGALPEKWRGGAFVAMHGSWNRGPATGYKVVWQPFNPDGTSPMPTSTATATTFPYEIVFGGGNASAPRDGSWSWAGPGGGGEEVRPAGVTVSPIDGALYIASDQGGGIYRVGVKR
jgi:glucose/arabinose dehydrogenase